MQGVIAAFLLLLPALGHAQITAQQADQIRNVMGDRIEALTILAGDYGLAGGALRSTGTLEFGGTANAQLNVTKAGGEGNIGDPRPLGDLNIGWQPLLGGNIGFIDTSNTLSSPLLSGDVNKFKGYAVEFGGGVRFWLSDAISVAPSVDGIVARNTDSYEANSAFMKAHLAAAEEMGLVNWSVDTWSVRPAVDLRYQVTLGRTILSIYSDPTYFHTQIFNSSNSSVTLGSGDSGYLANTVEIDIPLGMFLFGHELRTGGFYTNTELFGGLKAGLSLSSLEQVHGRFVLDFLDELWKVQWIGIGASYIWGSTLSGFTVGVDAAFQF